MSRLLNSRQTRPASSRAWARSREICNAFSMWRSAAGKSYRSPCAREIENEGRIESLFTGRLLDQADALLVIVPPPCTLGFPAESLARRIRFILIWPVHACEKD